VTKKIPGVYICYWIYLAPAVINYNSVCDTIANLHSMQLTIRPLSLSDL
jgi:hypothetical protein